MSKSIDKIEFRIGMHIVRSDVHNLLHSFLLWQKFIYCIAYIRAVCRYYNEKISLTSASFCVLRRQLKAFFFCSLYEEIN